MGLPDQESATPGDQRAAYIEALQVERAALDRGGDVRRVAEIDVELNRFDEKPSGKPGKERA